MYERQPERRSACKAALRSALGVFQRATLINVGTNYDVNHEALIRGWKTYSNWLKDARRRVDRLVTVDHIIGDSGAPEQIGGLARMWTKLTPLSSDVERCARASQIAGDETSADLQDVLGPDGAFSDQWARQTLERSDAASPNPHANTRSIDGSARRGPADGAGCSPVSRGQGPAAHQTRCLCGTGSSFDCGTDLAFRQNVMQQRLNVAQEELAEHFRFFRFQTEATVVLPNAARSAANDRELYAAISLARGPREATGSKAGYRRSSRRLSELSAAA